MALNIVGSQNEKENIGIICGGGNLPLEIATEIKNSGREPFLFGINGEVGNEISQFNHQFLDWGQLGTLFKSLKQHNIQKLLFAGAINQRPDFLKIKLDATALLTIPKILGSMLGGDNTVIKSAIGIFEDKGIRLIGIQDVAPSLLVSKGLIIGKKPNKSFLKNMKIGCHACQEIGKLDIGQAVVCENNRIIAVEGAEGTDALVQRVEGLRSIGRIPRKGKSGVLIKLLKPGQDQRVDLPAIGPKTIDFVHKAGLKGIVLDACQSIILERDNCLQLAKKQGIFIYGVDEEFKQTGVNS